MLKDGCHSGTANVKDVTTNDIVRMMIGRDLGQQFVQKTNVPGEVVLEARHLSNSHIHDVSLKVRKGEVLGIGGLIGAGRTELLRALFGIDEYQGESILQRQAYLQPLAPGCDTAPALPLSPRIERILA